MGKHETKKKPLISGMAKKRREFMVEGKVGMKQKRQLKALPERL
jgi:hypothetical protein